MTDFSNKPEYQLTDQQETAFEFIKNVLTTQPICLLVGSAGTGKTTLTKKIANFYSQQGWTLCAVAPTHKAKNVIQKILSEKQFMQTTAFTVASLLGKMKEHSYIGTKKFTGPSSKKFSSYKLFILDEVSMVSNYDLQFIVRYITSMNKKLIIIGDNYQIPCPSAPYTVTNIVVKQDSYIFTTPDINKIILTDVVRQTKDSPILELTCYVRDHIEDEFSIMDTGYTNITEEADVYEHFVRMYRLNPLSTKMIAYTNHTVRTHNENIRDKLGYSEKFVIGELMTGYANIGFPEFFIQNGQDYTITKIIATTQNRVSEFKNLSGVVINLQVVASKDVSNNLFFINPMATENYEFMEEFVLRSEKVNKQYSTKQEFIMYNELKNMVIFIEDVYKYNNQLYNESDFKEAHCLLFTRLAELIKNKEKLTSKLVSKIEKVYSNIIDDRIADNKLISDSEMLADKYKVVEKDIYYGYSITAHKSQGSTYDYVIVDETDLNKINDKINYKYNKLEKRTREKNQIRYVAYSRAKHELLILQNT